MHPAGVHKIIVEAGMLRRSLCALAYCFEESLGIGASLNPLLEKDIVPPHPKIFGCKGAGLLVDLLLDERPGIHVNVCGNGRGHQRLCRIALVFF